MQAAERAGVDRTTIMRVRQVAKQGCAGRAVDIEARGQDGAGSTGVGRGQGGDRAGGGSPTEMGGGSTLAQGKGRWD